MGEMIEQLNKKIEAGEPAYIYKAIQPTFGWDTAINYLQYCADTSFGEPIAILNYKLPLADKIDSINPVKEYLSENIVVGILGADMYVSLSTIGEHAYISKNDSLLWNVIGKSTLIAFGNSRLVEEGDLIFIPKNTEYIVKPETARAFVLFSLEQGEQNGD